MSHNSAITAAIAEQTQDPAHHIETPSTAPDPDEDDLDDLDGKLLSYCLTFALY